ncbi:hypothetical protein TRFO_10259 [Tritrichomonas foetus]|uniref:Uncharacterized protein n=1 Tax=Tritrichomonas foetus TaxID=1144522 RepID=A0A1J4J9I5_9EUKA|nr:hypothetical protein TRFO_10259 [Tritrichomonas foetus]|eukprot:OHS95858.1 hypothetical protein TRFO_10259 [Tritrichomonas foetus]
MTNIYNFLGIPPKRIGSNTPNISPSSTVAIQAQASTLVRNYFRSIEVDQTAILLRQPQEELANPISTIIDDFRNTRTKFSSIFNVILKEKIKCNYEIRDSKRAHYAEILRMISKKEYEKLISFAKLLLMKNTGLACIPYFGYMASICARSRENELFFVKAIEKTIISKEDYPTFIHILDEIRCLEMNKNFVPLLVAFMKFYPGDLSTFITGGYRIVPGYYQYMSHLKGGAATAEALAIIKRKAAKNIPKLEPESEENFSAEKQPNDEQK